MLVAQKREWGGNECREANGEDDDDEAEGSRIERVEDGRIQVENMCLAQSEYSRHPSSHCRQLQNTIPINQRLWGKPGVPAAFSTLNQPHVEMVNNDQQVC